MQVAVERIVEDAAGGSPCHFQPGKYARACAASCWTADPLAYLHFAPHR